MRWWRSTRLWRLTAEDVLEWAGGNAYRRGQLDGWLIRHGLPPGSELAAGSVCAVRDWRGRTWLYGRRLGDGRWVRAGLLEQPPARLRVTPAA